MLRPFFRGCFNGLWHTTAAAAAAEEAVLSGSLGVWGCCCTSLGRLHLSGKNGWREAIVIQVILSLIDKNKPVMSSQVKIPFQLIYFKICPFESRKANLTSLTIIPTKWKSRCFKITKKVSFNHASEAFTFCLHFEWTKVNWKLQNLKLAVG